MFNPPPAHGISDSPNQSVTARELASAVDHKLGQLQPTVHKLYARTTSWRPITRSKASRSGQSSG